MRRKEVNRRELDEILLSTPNLNATARVILLAYARTMKYIEEPETTWQGTQALANYAGVSLDTLAAYTKALEADGYLILVKEEWKNSRKRKHYSLGRGELVTPLLMKRKPNSGSTNLIPGARQKVSGSDPESHSLGTTQKGSLGTTQKGFLGGAEGNTKGFTKENTKPVADAPVDPPDKTDDELTTGLPSTSSIPPSEAAVDVAGTPEKAPSGSDPETYEAMCRELDPDFNFKAYMKIPGMTPKRVWKQLLERKGK